MRYVKSVVGGVLACLAWADAWALDIAPAEYLVRPAGTNVGFAYLQAAGNSSFHLNGIGKVPQSDLVARAAVLRLMRFETLGEMPISFHAFAPFGTISKARIGGVNMPRNAGSLDVTVGASIFPVVLPRGEFGTTIGLSLFATLPIGKSNPAAAAISAGATVLTPQIGFIQGLGRGFFLDGAFDAAFEQDQHKAGLRYSREVSFQAQTYLRYQVSEKTSVSVGYSGRFRGAQTVAGLPNGLQTRVDQLRFVADTYLTPKTQIQGMVASEVNASGGFSRGLIGQARILQLF